ncbi:alpha/beta fold hydrolase [Phytopseudomonas dryadis]|uniref:Alpha/beta hydrolase n=1 Tax=Phytopseudomonas dryadis TaxID=2487520 RepID=A0A4Q9R589_9GAMM|nr:MULTISPECIES: alpha/beta hydrolase [Pseudomonas]TBU95637.1 alpha/beta hydrolase [Pseudomonas dryadis]TBV01390.1 alpha/beta hydrolase [Pseudomonas dryadis]TBV14144.1 alpha/beta hydrolase [Pseudomonas sp. FRB 230]
MQPAFAVVDVHRTYKVHTEFHANPSARKTIILVNGSLATTASFAQTVKYLKPQFNVVLYDQPYSGQSKAHNSNERPISKEDEAAILLELIDHYRADHLMSFSWGGVATMLALAKRPPTIEKVVMASFSPLLNEPMIDYLERGLTYLQQEDGDNVGHLVNSTIGKHLPSLFKRYNHRHISSLANHEYRQMHAHIHQVLRMEAHCQLDCLAAIDIPILFVNGEHDEYTSAKDARQFAKYLNDCQFVTIDNAGHFLDMEHKNAWLQSQSALLNFLQSTPSSNRKYAPQPGLHHALAV